MSLTGLDWTLVLGIAALPLAVGFACRRRAGGSPQQFFLSGRDLPWWLSGTSMVATTFAADTPLAVTGIVAASGLAGNWLWWNAALGTMLTVFFFARLWRRAGITTDVEFAELRYTGRPAAFLRGFRALYLGLPINCLIIGWVNLALAKVLAVVLGWERLTAVLLGLAVTGCYTALAGPCEASSSATSCCSRSPSPEPGRWRTSRSRRPASGASRDSPSGSPTRRCAWRRPSAPAHPTRPRSRCRSPRSLRSSASSGGQAGIRARNREAAGTWPSA